MQISDILTQFRTVNPADYPEVAGYSREEIYKNKMGPGGLYLAALMARRLDLHPGELVLDLGCGMGTTSIFLAREYQVDVVALDLWINATVLQQQFARQQLTTRVIPLQLDVTQTLPFADDAFDAVFCMDSLHYYGGRADFFQHLLRVLKPGGRLCIGSPCFNTEFTLEQLANLPAVYDDGTNLWPHEFSQYHSTAWWGKLVEETGLVTIEHCDEIADGVILWEDDVLFNLALFGDKLTAAKDAEQITFRQPGWPYLTHFVLAARKLPGRRGESPNHGR